MCTGTCISNYLKNFEKHNPLFIKGISPVLPFSGKINVLTYISSRKSILIMGKKQDKIILGFKKRVLHSHPLSLTQGENESLHRWAENMPGPTSSSEFSLLQNYKVDGVCLGSFPGAF